MQYRPLGASGLTVSALGFGAWGIGGHTPGGRSYGHTDDAVSLAALNAAHDAGITFYDTAPLYGLGHSETLIGRAFAGRRDSVVIATKAGYRDFSSPQDFTGAGLRQSVDDSLRRLGTDYIDVLQLHDLPAQGLRDDPAIVETLAGLQAQGKVRVCGVSVKSPEDALVLMEQPLIQVFQVNFNMLDARAIDCGLFEQAVRRGVGLIARTPLCFGFATGTLTGAEAFSAEDHRSGWPLARRVAWAEGARRMHDIARQHEGAAASGVALALRYVLSFNAVSTTIPGMFSPAEVLENAAAASGAPFSEDILASLVACSRDIGRQAA